MILDHVVIAVRDFAKSKAFYSAALAPLGIRIVTQQKGVAGFNQEGGRGGFRIGGAATPPGAVHLAFAARDRAAGRAFYHAAIAAGACDNGAPGLRPQYHPDYCGAFVLDPDGHNIEAMCHAPEPGKAST